MRQALADLERVAERAIESGDTSELDIIGFGEISTVLRLRGDTATFAAKRLPPFPPGAFEPYSEVFSEYLRTLGSLGVVTSESWLETFDGGEATTVYCIQPMHDTLLVDRLVTATGSVVRRYAAQLVAIVTNAVRPSVGLDAQVSNWAIDEDDAFIYIDVTTPLMRDDAGADLLDTDLFIASLPAILRPGVRRFLLTGILDSYYDRRTVLLDVVANLTKEELHHTVAPFLDEVNKVTEPEITPEEAAAYYRSNSRLWEVLQRLRKADRWWQRSVRRRSYPFMLPGRIDR